MLSIEINFPLLFEVKMIEQKKNETEIQSRFPFKPLLSLFLVFL